MAMGMIVVMPVVVIMAIKRERPFGPCAEQLTIFRRSGNDLWRAFATDVTVKANHTVRGAHHNVKFVAHHQNRTAEAIAQVFDQLIKRRRPRLIKALRRLIQHQNIR